MITSVPMELVSLVVLRDKTEEVASRILALGVFHPVDLRNIDDTLRSLSSYQVEKEMAACDGLQARMREIARMLSMDIVSVYNQDIGGFSYSAAGEFLDTVDKEASSLIDNKERLERQLLSDQSILTHVRDYMPFAPSRSSLYSFLEISTGKIEEKNMVVLEKSLVNTPYVIYPFSKVGSKLLAMVIGLRKDRPILHKVLHDVAWEEISYPQDVKDVSEEAQAKLARKIDQTKAGISQLNGRINAFAGQQAAKLGAIHSAVRVRKSILEAKRLSCFTDKTALFSGWVPSSERANVVKGIKSISGVSYVESKSPESMDIPKEDVPVQFRHSRMLKPFEMLIDAYGIPRYGTIDPTLFVALMFLLMFGVMFGDLGHGVILAILGFLLRRNPQTPVKQGGTLLIYSGISAALFGVLYGSVFGVEFRGLWLKPTESAMYMFGLSLMFGIAVISLGIIINVINAVRDRDYFKMLFDKAGLIAGLVYWAGIGVVTKLVVEHSPVSSLLVNVVFGGFALIFAGPMILFFVRRHGSNFFEALMHGVVGILEVGMGYLANTISFLRITGFALTHACLFLAIFELSKAMKGLPGGMILVIGNFIVFCLEGLVVTMQSVRLNYYEFFSKFFIPGKQHYKPLTIPGNESINR